MDTKFIIVLFFGIVFVNCNQEISWTFSLHSDNLCNTPTTNTDHEIYKLGVEYDGEKLTCNKDGITLKREFKVGTEKSPWVVRYESLKNGGCIDINTEEFKKNMKKYFKENAK